MQPQKVKNRWHKGEFVEPVHALENFCLAFDIQQTVQKTVGLWPLLS